MIGCLWTHVHKQPIIALYFESENELKFYNLKARALFLGEMVAKLEMILSTALQNNDLTHAKTTNNGSNNKHQ